MYPVSACLNFVFPRQEARVGVDYWGLRRMVWINWMWYGFGALMVNQFSGSETRLSGEDTTLSYYSLEGVNEWVLLLGSAVSVLVLLVIAYAALTFVRHQKR